jgi:hypothetical protein
MKKILFVSFVIILILPFSGCNVNDGTSGLPGNPDNAFAQNFGSEIAKDFIGQVVDINNNPLQGVAITIGTKTALTDVNGVFIVNAATVHEQFAYITAEKVGYFDGSRSLVPSPTGKNNVRIMMIANTPTATIQSDEASEVSLPDGSKVSVDGAFQDENGNGYSGTVSVAVYHLKASEEKLDKLMPGMLYGQTEMNQEAILETYGMLNVELRGATGQRLNLSDGHTAEILMPIETSQLGSAPTLIPLWHFDEARGYWKEDGVATRVGNNYVGDVSHFSWWNCDAFSQMVTLTVKLVDANGNPLSNLGVGLIANGATYPVMGITNANGLVSGLIPANQGLTLNVYPNYYSCNTSNIIYTAPIGPFLVDTTLPDIVINNSISVTSSNVVGTLLKCDNTNVTFYPERVGNPFRRSRMALLVLMKYIAPEIHNLP